MSGGFRLLANVVSEIADRSNAAADAQDRLNASMGKAPQYSTGFAKLLEFKDAQGETGGTTFTEAWKLLNAQLDVTEQARANPANANLAIFAADAMRKLEDFFRRVFPQLGDVRTLLRNLEAFRSSEAAAERREPTATADDVKKSQAQTAQATVALLIPYLGRVENMLREAARRAERPPTSTPVVPSTKPSPTPQPSSAVLIWQGSLKG